MQKKLMAAGIGVLMVLMTGCGADLGEPNEQVIEFELTGEVAVAPGTGQVVSVLRDHGDEFVLRRGSGGSVGSLVRGGDNPAVLSEFPVAELSSEQYSSAWTLSSDLDQGSLLISAGSRFGVLSGVDDDAGRQDFAGVRTGIGSLAPVTGLCRTKDLLVLASGGSDLMVRSIPEGNVLGGRQLAQVIVTDQEPQQEVVTSAGPSTEEVALGEQPPVLPGHRDRLPVGGLRSLTCLTEAQAKGLGVTRLSVGKDVEQSPLVLAVVDAELSETYKQVGGATLDHTVEAVVVDSGSGMVVRSWKVAAKVIDIDLDDDGHGGVLVDRAGRVFSWKV